MSFSITSGVKMTTNLQVDWKMVDSPTGIFQILAQFLSSSFVFRCVLNLSHNNVTQRHPATTNLDLQNEGQ
jgi:hypothetical protein